MAALKRTPIRHALLGVGIWLMAIGICMACSIPVFRYALERWPSDPYEVFVFYKGKLADSDEKLLTAVESRESGDDQYSNIRVTRVNLEADIEEELEQIWNSQKTDKLPWMTILYPVVSRNPTVVWSGPFTTDNTEILVDSPARKEVAKRLLKGETAVWVFLKSGDAKKDAATQKLLEAELKELAKVLKLPDELIDEQGNQVQEQGTKLRIAFSVVSVSREDPKEKMFVEMLLKTEADLSGMEEPMAFPIFGRGRALYALVGRGINRENIQEAGAFLAGPCSCQVKELNPGTDILMSVNWDDQIAGTVFADRELPPLSGLPDYTEIEIQSESSEEREGSGSETVEVAKPELVKEAETVPIAPAKIAVQPAPQAKMSSMMRNILLVAALLAVGILAASFLVYFNKSA